MATTNADAVTLTVSRDELMLLRAAVEYHLSEEFGEVNGSNSLDDPWFKKMNDMLDRLKRLEQANAYSYKGHVYIVRCPSCHVTYEEPVYGRQGSGHNVASLMQCGTCGHRAGGRFYQHVGRVFRGPVLIVDQFSGYTPYWLSQHPMDFEALCETVSVGRRLTIDDTFKMPECSTVFCAGPDGRAEVLATRWDSSG